MRLIDADTLLNIYKSWLSQFDSLEDNGDRDGVESCIAALEDSPTIEAEHIVRCKECKYFQPYEGEEHKGDCEELIGLDSFVYEDDYCSYGEKIDAGGA